MAPPRPRGEEGVQGLKGGGGGPLPAGPGLTRAGRAGPKEACAGQGQENGPHPRARAVTPEIRKAPLKEAGGGGVKGALPGGPKPAKGARATGPQRGADKAPRGPRGGGGHEHKGGADQGHGGNPAAHLGRNLAAAGALPGKAVSFRGCGLAGREYAVLPGL